MNEYIFNKNNYKSYKDFYEEFYKSFNIQEYGDFDGCENLRYSADLLDEFMFYISRDNVKIVLIGCDLDVIKQQKTYDNYEWNIIVRVLSRFVEEYPNNTLEFRNE